MLAVDSDGIPTSNRGHGAEDRVAAPGARTPCRAGLIARLTGGHHGSARSVDCDSLRVGESPWTAGRSASAALALARLPQHVIEQRQEARAHCQVAFVERRRQSERDGQPAPCVTLEEKGNPVAPSPDGARSGKLHAVESHAPGASNAAQAGALGTEPRQRRRVDEQIAGRIPPSRSAGERLQRPAELRRCRSRAEQRRRDAAALEKAGDCRASLG